MYFKLMDICCKQNITGEKEGKYKGNTVEIEGKYRRNTGEIKRNLRENTVQVQENNRVNTEEIQRKYREHPRFIPTARCADLDILSKGRRDRQTDITCDI